MMAKYKNTRNQTPPLPVSLRPFSPPFRTAEVQSVFSKALFSSAIMSTSRSTERQVMTINQLQQFDREWTVKVIILRITFESFENAKRQGKLCKIILADQEGSRIRGIMFDEIMEKFKDNIQKDNTYIISNGTIKRTDKKYLNVHEKYELNFSNNTIIEETDDKLSLENILHNFTAIKDVQQKENQAKINIIAFLTKVNPMFSIMRDGDKRPSKKRDITVMDEDETTIQATLWGDLAETEGTLLEEMVNKKTIIALSNMRITTFAGEPRLQSSQITTLQINPDLAATKEKMKWLNAITSNEKGLEPLTPSKRLREATSLTLAEVITAEARTSQVKIVKTCREFGMGSGGFYQPGYHDGAKLHLKMMCLGKNWDPETSKYDDLRPIDGAKPPDIPTELHQLVKGAIQDSHAYLQNQSKVRNVKESIPSMSPNICILNFYASSGRLGLHQFKELTQAYEVLSNPEKRDIYDQYGEDALNKGMGGGGGGHDPFDIFQSFFGSENPFGAKKLSLSRNVICSKCKGKGSKSDASMKCAGCQGSGMKASIRHLGPSMIQQMQRPCNEGKGTGELSMTRIAAPNAKARTSKGCRSLTEF